MHDDDVAGLDPMWQQALHQEASAVKVIVGMGEHRDAGHGRSTIAQEQILREASTYSGGKVAVFSGLEVFAE